MLRLVLIFAVMVLVFATAETSAQQRTIREEKIGDGVMVTVLPQDAIRALKDPAFVPRAEAETWMHDDEPVIGVVNPASGRARAYSLWHLDRHEIVNDRLGDKPIAVTW